MAGAPHDHPALAPARAPALCSAPANSFLRIYFFGRRRFFFLCNGKIYLRKALAPPEGTRLCELSGQLRTPLPPDNTQPCFAPGLRDLNTRAGSSSERRSPDRRWLCPLGRLPASTGAGFTGSRQRPGPCPRRRGWSGTARGPSWTRSLMGTGKGVSAQPKAHSPHPTGTRAMAGAACGYGDTAPSAPTGTGRTQKLPRGGLSPRQEGFPQTGGIPADRVCAGGTRGISLQETGHFGRQRKEEREGEIPRLLGPALPRGNSLVGDSFPVCSLISIAGACPRAEVRGRLSPSSTSESLGQSSVTHVPGLWGQRDPRWAPLWDAAAGPAIPAASAREGAASTICLRLQPRSVSPGGTVCPQQPQPGTSPPQPAPGEGPAAPGIRLPGCHGAESPVGYGVEARAGISLSFLLVQGATWAVTGRGRGAARVAAPAGAEGLEEAVLLRIFFPC